MRTILVLLTAALTGCIDNPAVKVVTPNGTVMRFTTGRNLMAEVDEQVSEVQAPGGYHLRHMVKRQDSTRVPIALAQTAGTLGLGYIAYLDSLAKQVTERVVAGEITKREGQRLLAEIEQARIAAEVSGATVVNPNIALPLRK